MCLYLCLAHGLARCHITPPLLSHLHQTNKQEETSNVMNSKVSASSVAGVCAAQVIYQNTQQDAEGDRVFRQTMRYDQPEHSLSSPSPPPFFPLPPPLHCPHNFEHFYTFAHLDKDKMLLASGFVFVYCLSVCVCVVSLSFIFLTLASVNNRNT